MSDRPTEEQIREALEWLESAVTLVYDGPNEARVRTALHLARRGAQRTAADKGSTHWPGCWRVHGECAVVLLDEAAGLLRHSRDYFPPDVSATDALLARIDPEAEEEGL